jgi:hypothetical protein
VEVSENILWCYPLPLLEEAKTITKYKSKNPLVLLDKSVDVEPPQHLNNNIALTAGIKSIMKIPSINYY